MEESRYILFENYLYNELNATEKTAFESQLQTDVDFLQEFEIYKNLEASLSSKFNNEKEELDLRATLTNLGNEYVKEEEVAKKETKVISLFNYKSLMVAASIALLIGFFLMKDGNPVYGDFANHGTLEIVVRGENSEDIIDAEKAFNSQNYLDALQALKILSDAQPKDIELQLYKGICHLELNNFTDADRIFEEISTGESAFSTKATWYKALSFLKQEKIAECKVELQKIPATAEEFKQAEKLLKKL